MKANNTITESGDRMSSKYYDLTKLIRELIIYEATFADGKSKVVSDNRINSIKKKCEMTKEEAYSNGYIPC